MSLPDVDRASIISANDVGLEPSEDFNPIRPPSSTVDFSATEEKDGQTVELTKITNSDSDFQRLRSMSTGSGLTVVLTALAKAVNWKRFAAGIQARQASQTGDIETLRHLVAHKKPYLVGDARPLNLVNGIVRSCDIRALKVALEELFPDITINDTNKMKIPVSARFWLRFWFIKRC